MIEISIVIKTNTTAVIKNEFKENTCLAEPNLEVLPLI